MKSTSPASARLATSTPTDLPDEELLRWMRTDDRDAYGVLVERHVDRAYGAALRILRNAADAETVAQDSLVLAWTRRHLWQPGRVPFSTWLYREVFARCLDLPRSSADEVRDDGHDRLEAALDRLPDLQRVALVLSYHQDCSNGQVADIMGTSIDAVESLLKQGRRRLRRILGRPRPDLAVA